MTGTGIVVGTAAYLSPEQARGETVLPATDVYALGLVLLEGLTGAREFPGPPVQAAAARLRRSPRIPDELEPGLAGLLGTMTSTSAADRPTAREAGRVLRRLAARAETPVTVPLVAGAWTEAAAEPSASSGPSEPAEPSGPAGPAEWSEPTERPEPSAASAPSEPSEPSAPSDPSGPTAASVPAGPTAPLTLARPWRDRIARWLPAGVAVLAAAVALVAVLNGPPAANPAADPVTPSTTRTSAPAVVHPVVVSTPSTPAHPPHRGPGAGPEPGSGPEPRPGHEKPKPGKP